MRSGKKAQVDGTIEADPVFTVLVGDEVEPRREFIETNAAGCEYRRLIPR